MKKALTLDEHRAIEAARGRPVTDGPMRGGAGAKHCSGGEVREREHRSSPPLEDPSLLELMASDETEAQ